MDAQKTIIILAQSSLITTSDENNVLGIMLA